MGNQAIVGFERQCQTTRQTIGWHAIARELTRRGNGLGCSWGRKQTAGGKTEKHAKPTSSPAKRTARSFKPQRTVKLLEGTPCFLPGCPNWLRAPSLWSPRLSARQVDIKQLGSGRHGSSVLRVVRRGQPDARAVAKQFSREQLLAAPRLHDKVLNEWRVHSALVPHPNVVPLYGALEDRSYVTLLMEAQRGDLLSYLDERGVEVLGEAEARGVVADVLAALEHMHSLGFVHRDIKAENVFAEPVAPHGVLGAGSGGGGGGSVACWRLGDLGSAVELAAVMEPGGPGLHLEGSPPFLAPEYAALWVAPTRSLQQLQEATSPKQDIWGVGALLYDTLVGHAPFSGPDPDKEPPLPALAAAIVSDEPAPSPAAAGLSPGAADFISQALRKEPARRPSATELLAHPWLAGAR